MNIARAIPALRADPELIYLDSAATALTPDILHASLLEYYTHIHAPVHRSTCPRAERATVQYEHARGMVAQLMHAYPDEVVFTAGATAGIQLVIESLARPRLQPGDRLVLNPLEHHSNLLPWIRLAQRHLCDIDWAITDQYGYIDPVRTGELIGPRTKIVTGALASHVIGVYQDSFWAELITRAHAVGALVIGDASQYVGHRPLVHPYTMCDVLVLSAHKMMGPTGIGAVRIVRAHHDHITPWLLGGGMVESVEISGQSTTWLGMPHLLQAGTPPTAQAYAWAQVIAWQQDQYSLGQLRIYESDLITHAVNRLHKIPGIRVLMPSGNTDYSHLVSFYHDRMHAHDIAHMLGERHICVRAGSLCAQPAMDKLGTPAVVRISVHGYSTRADIDTCLDNLEEIVKK